MWWSEKGDAGRDVLQRVGGDGGRVRYRYRRGGDKSK